MNKRRTNPVADTRTPAQKELDERVASGNWEGFELEELLTQEGADQIIEHCENLRKELEMDQALIVCPDRLVLARQMPIDASAIMRWSGCEQLPKWQKNRPP